MTTTTVTGHVRASRAAVFGALVDPAAIAAWRVPDGMTAQVHEFEPRPGGRIRVSLTYDGDSDLGVEVGKTSGRTDTYSGHVASIEPDREVVEVLAFETPGPSVTMTMTTTLHDAGGGTDVVVVHEGIPDAVSPADNETGTRMALARLAALVEGGVRARPGSPG